MEITKLDHVNVRTARLQPMIDWYTTVLGLRPGPRPNFAFDGAWLYAGESAIIHLVAVGDDNSVGSEAPLKFEHFALRGTGRGEFEARLKALTVPYQSSELAPARLVLYNLWDPDGNHIHVDFSTDE